MMQKLGNRLLLNLRPYVSAAMALLTHNKRDAKRYKLTSYMIHHLGVSLVRSPKAARQVMAACMV